MRFAFKQAILISVLISLVFFNTSFWSIAWAQDATTTNEIMNRIEERNIQIKHLEDQIQQYNQEVDNANKQGVTLQNTLKTLDLTKKKITTDINLTQNKITKTVLTIEQLDNEINKAQDNIDLNKEAITNAIKDIRVLDNLGLVKIVLSNRNIGDVWSEMDYINETRDVLRNKSKELAVLKTDMETKQTSLKGQKASLVNLKQDLSGKQQAVIYTAKEKATLLAQTKNKEETFKQLVKTTEEQKAQFEQEVYQYESQLNIAVDKSGYPAPSHGILSWPLDNVFITQRFGKTVGAQKLYTSGSHNGVDFRASVGTKVKNVLDGVVVGTGNTDAYPGCYSFGKWVMVKHDNGLSTIYGHLSVISTSVGQSLSTGDLIGYSGNTGYSTGPHLHISLYATQGVRIEKYINSIGCKQAIIPLADIKAYLDPLAYFPN